MIEDKNEINFSNVNVNKKRSKKRDFNTYGKVTALVRRYQETKNQDDLLEILNALEGIINTYTIILTPGEIRQTVFHTPYMKRFLGMFLTKEEQVSTGYNTFNRGMQRIRWIMRGASYEDMYAKIVEIIIGIVATMKIIGNCDCIYYIQMMVKYKLYDMIMKTARDATVNIVAIECMLANMDDDGDGVDSTLDKLYFKSSDVDFEEEVINGCFYNDITLSVLLETRDLFKMFNGYEKYLMYLRNGINMNLKQMLSILVYETQETLINRFASIDDRLDEISKEHLYV
jgi:hypothetical protein